MKIKRVVSLASFSLCLISATVQLSGCSSAPKPAEVDGNARVPANDPAKIQALQQRLDADRQLLAENNLLRAQVDVLQAKLIEMTGIVREALTLPQQQKPALAMPQTKPSAVPAPPAMSPQSLVFPELPREAYSTNSNGVVIRVFHGFAKTDFEPSEQVAQALRDGVKDADRIEVRGRTDSSTVNPIDRLIAVERAIKARTWLVNNGAQAEKIRTTYLSAGQFIANNQTEEGRALNRRVEIEIQNQRLAKARQPSNS